MKKFILFTAIISSFALSACSDGRMFSNAQPVNSNQQNINSTVAPPVNGANISESDAPPTGSLTNMDANIGKRRKVFDSVSAPEGNSPPQQLPAAFDSTIATTMNKQNQFLETRTFKSDPLLKKVERVQEAKTMKVYLKNGKVLDMPYEKNDLFVTASPQDILAAVGIKPQSVQQNETNPQKREQLKREQQ
jgi:hypothetical protein